MFLNKVKGVWVWLREVKRKNIYILISKKEKNIKKYILSMFTWLISYKC